MSSMLVNVTRVGVVNVTRVGEILDAARLTEISPLGVLGPEATS